MRKIIVVILIILYTALIQITFVSAKSVEGLYEQIQEYKKSFDIKGQDARCDKVFKLVPGINGRYIDVEKSYRNMRRYKLFDPTMLVIENERVLSIDDLSCGPIYKGNEMKNEVTFIINVAWGEEYVKPMLEVLSKYNVKVNFFVEGKFAYKNLDLIFDIHKDGHLIGNHSYSHSDYTTLTKEQAFKDLMDTNFVLEAITNYKLKYFGPPSGAFKEETIDVVHKINMKTIMWSIDTIDWQKPSIETIKERVIPKLENGSIVLMHPTLNTSLALEDIIKACIKKDLKITTLDNLLY